MNFVLSELRELTKTRPDQIREYQGAISKMLILNLDPLETQISPLYPPTGRMVDMQMEIYRSFVLMKHVGIPLNNWVEKLENNPVLRTIAGFTEFNMPKTSSYYDFMNRIVKLDERPRTKGFKRKPKTKYGKNEKQPPKNPNITNKLKETYFDSEEKFMRRLNGRAERYLQKSLHLLPSILPLKWV